MKKTFDVTLEHAFPTTRHTVEVADIPNDPAGTALACVTAAEKAYFEEHQIFRSDRKVTMAEVVNPADTSPAEAADSPPSRSPPAKVKASDAAAAGGSASQQVKP